MEHMTAPAIDPSAGVDGALSAIVGGVNDNLPAVATVGGAMLAVGIVWKLVRRFAK